MAALMLAGGRGAKKRIGVDTQPDRVETARRLGLLDEGLVAGPDTLERVKEATRGGADVSFDCSGSPRGRLLALQATALWGRCVYLGEQDTVEFRVSEDLMHRQRQIIGSWVTSLHNMEKCCRDLADWGDHPDAIVTHRFALTEAPQAYAVMAEGKCGKVVIATQ
jgi:threonine dehydrogenase-like Zn-dependent dehydrogenase